MRERQAAVVAVLLLASVGVGKAAAATLQSVIDDARQEGQLSIVAGESILGGANARLIDAFNKYYGLSIDVRFTPGPPVPAMVATVIQQTQAHKQAATDVIIGFSNHMFDLINAHAIQKPDWQDWAPNLKGPGLVSSEGEAVPVQSGTPGIAYNTTVFQSDDIPTKFQALLDPKLKGRVATTVYASYLDRLALPEMWGREKTFDFARKLSDQVGGLIRCNELNRLASGEFDVFGLTCSQTDPLVVAAKGAPVGFTLASDAPIIMLLYEAVPVMAAHPNTAKLWINFMSSPEGQKLLYEVSFADLSLLPGSQTAKSIAAVEAKGAKFLVIDVDFYRQHDAAAMNRDLAEAQKIFQTR
ncbi:MAG TPA: extracellular solute-binding protein [Stellaceae bacterium]|jgi:ABC-type Fe3+ transport system substrate-binding protein